MFGIQNQVFFFFISPKNIQKQTLENEKWVKKKLAIYQNYMPVGPYHMITLVSQFYLNGLLSHDYMTVMQHNERHNSVIHLLLIQS